MPITAFNSFTDGLDPNQQKPRALRYRYRHSETTVAGCLMPMVSGSSPAISTARPADSALF